MVGCALSKGHRGWHQLGVDYDGVAHFMLPHLDVSGVTLVVDCGNSDVSGRMCAEASSTS